MRYSYFVQTLYIILFTVFTCISVYLNKMFNNEKLLEIEGMKTESENMSKEVYGIADNVRDSAINTNKIIEELERTSNNSLQMLKEISKGNSINSQCIERQIIMANNITEMIDGVLEDTNKVSLTTEMSLNSLKKSKNSFDDLKGKSRVIVKNNEKVIDTINLFVDNVRNVKKITQDIVDISEQTNLLSLNASIESARVGELGKGFAVVANEIRTLADRTNELTEDINKIVQALEYNAVDAQNVVHSVVNDINEENDTMDMTIDDLAEMEEHIVGLGSYVDNILGKVKNLSEFNMEIEKNVSSIVDSSKDVEQCTNKALVINEKNKENADKTKELMEELLVTAKKLDVYKK